MINFISTTLSDCFRSQSMTGTMTTPTLTSSTPSRSPGEQTDAVMPPPRNIKQLKTRSSGGQQKAKNQTSSVTTTCPISTLTTTSGTGNTLPITTTASSESPKIIENVEEAIVAKPRNSTEPSKEEVEASEKVHTKPPTNTLKSDKYIKLKTIEPKSVAAHGASIATELKSVAANAVTLSSLDTLNDIDSEEEVDEDETTENIFAIHNEILECNNIVFDKENDKLMMMLMSEEKRKSTSNERVKRANIIEQDQYEEDSEFIKHITRDNDEQESADQFNPNFFNQPGNYYNNFNMHANKFMFDQDWSYSQTQNSNAMNFSLNDQKLIGEIVRKLKPYIYKTIRKEVRLYFERNFPPTADTVVGARAY